MCVLPRTGRHRQTVLPTPSSVSGSRDSVRERRLKVRMPDNDACAEDGMTYPPTDVRTTPPIYAYYGNISLDIDAYLGPAC